MGYRIIENAFAPKIKDNWEIFNYTNSHAIIVNYCNFNCCFCGVDYAPENKYINYSLEEFQQVVLELMKKGKCFKFSGGEPTLNPRLREDLQIVKKSGGYVYLDTNGSCFDVVKELIDMNLIDVLAISLKGLDENEAIYNSGGMTKVLCWDNVWSTIDYAIQRNVKLVITYVCYNFINIDIVNRFAELFSEKNVFLKLNNYHKNYKKNCKFETIEENEIRKCVEQFLIKNPLWRNRMIIVDGEKAIGSFSNIIFL